MTVPSFPTFLIPQPPRPQAINADSSSKIGEDGRSECSMEVDGVENQSAQHKIKEGEQNTSMPQRADQEISDASDSASADRPSDQATSDDSHHIQNKQPQEMDSENNATPTDPLHGSGSNLGDNDIFNTEPDKNRLDSVPDGNKTNESEKRVSNVNEASIGESSSDKAVSESSEIRERNPSRALEKKNENSDNVTSKMTNKVDEKSKVVSASENITASNPSSKLSYASAVSKGTNAKENFEKTTPAKSYQESPQTKTATSNRFEVLDETSKNDVSDKSGVNEKKPAQDKKNKKKNEPKSKKDNATDAGSTSKESQQPLVQMSTVFRLYIPKRIQTTEVSVYYKKSSEKDEKSLKVKLEKTKNQCVWESKEVVLHVKDKVEYVYYYCYKKHISFLSGVFRKDGDEVVYECVDRILNIGSERFDIFNAVQHSSTITLNQDKFEGSWVYVKLVTQNLNGDVKSNLVLLADRLVLQSLQKNYYDYNDRDTVITETVAILQNSSDIQKQFLIYIVCKCLPYHTFRDSRLVSFLAKNCLNVFQHTDILNFPTGSDVVLKDIAYVTCSAAFGTLNPFFLVTGYYDCLTFGGCKELISKCVKRSGQDSSSIGQCFNKLIPGLQKGDDKAVNVCYMILEQIEEFEVILSISKTICCIEKIDGKLRKTIRDKTLKCSTEKAISSIEKISIYSKNGLSKLNNIIQRITDEDLQKKVKNVIEDKVMTVIKGKYSNWQDSEVEALHTIVSCSFVFDDFAFTRLLEEIAKSNTSNTQNLFVKILGRSKTLSESISGFCAEWLKKCIENAKTKHPVAREKRIAETYQCLGELLEIELVANDTNLSNDLDKIVRGEIEKTNIHFVMNAAPEVEKYEGKGHDVYICHVQELLLKQHGKFKTGKLNDHLESNLGDGKVINLDQYSHLCLVETILSLSDPNYIMDHQKAAKDRTVVLDIMDNMNFWTKIVAAEGIYAYKVKEHIATRNTEKVIKHLLINIKSQDVTMHFAKKLIKQVERSDVKNTEAFLKAVLGSQDVTFRSLVQNLQDKIANINSRIACIDKMFSWMGRYDGVDCCRKGKILLQDLDTQHKQFGVLMKDVSDDSKYNLSNIIASVGLEEHWYMSEAVSLRDVLELESFHQFFKNVLLNDAKCVTSLSEDVLFDTEEFTEIESVLEFKNEVDLEKGIVFLDDIEASEIADIDDDNEDAALDFKVVEEEIPEKGYEENKTAGIVRMITVTVSSMIQEISLKILPAFRKHLQDNIWSESDSCVNEVQYLFHNCQLDQEIQHLEKFIGKKLAPKSKKLIVYLRCHDEYVAKASHIARMCTVFGRNTLKDESTIGCSVKNILTMQEDPKTFTLPKLFSDMCKFEELTAKISIELWDVIHELSKCHVLVEFLNSVKNEDLRNLIDAVEEHSEQFVQESTVSDLIQVKSFLYLLLVQDKDTSVEKLLKELKNCFSHAVLTMPQMINNCSQNCNSLKALYMNVANRGEVTKEIVAKILEKGVVKFQIVNDTLDTKVFCKTGKTTISYNLVDLNDLRSRVLLISNTESAEQTHGDDKKGTLTNFVCICDLVVDISTLLQGLHLCGHFNFQEYKFESKEKLCANRIEELENLLEELEEIQQNWYDSLMMMRKKFYYLNFVHSKQFHVMSNYFSLGTRKEQALSIMQYIKPSLKKRIEVISTKPHKHDDITKTDIKYQLESLGQKLHEILGNNADVYTKFPSNEELWKQIENVDAKVYPGKVYVAHVDVKSMESIPIILSLYANTTGLFPLPNEALFCNEETSWEEVQLLINRCIFRSCSYENNLYCIIGIEKLQYEIQFQLVQCLKDLEKNDEKTRHDFLLAVLCRSVSHDNFLTSLSKHVHKAPSLGRSAMKGCLQKTCKEVYMITSDLPGQGKTEKIFSTAAARLLGVETVQISGPVSKEKLVQLMNNHKVRSYQTLHLDIGNVDQPHVVDNFIFELIVLKCAVAGIECAHLNTEYIAIEVANTLNNSLSDSLHVGSSFYRINEQWMNFKECLVSPEPESAIQTVCRYLSAIETDTIHIKDIKISSSEASLSKTDCHSLLQNIFGTEKELSYSVVNVFLEVLADQLRRFSASHYFKVSCLTAMLGDEKAMKTIRNDMIKALIKVSKEFSCRSISACKTTQLQAIEEVKASVKSETDAMLSRVEGMIQWSDSNHLLVLFQSQDSQTVSSLYREVSAVPGDVKKLIETQTRKQLPDFSEYSQDDLQRMLEKLVCTSRDTEVTERLGSLYKTYALTPDNILKMILVIMRIRTGIPVILMGETGCGKTTLVKYLAITCGVDLEVFPFHAGITKQMLTRQILSWNEKARDSNGAEHWIFLDEINTCDHLGVLKEIICHKTCDGQKLAPNLAVIAACNPYRIRDKNQVFTSGLQGKTLTDEFSCLVYRVHPLPEAMIDYVWDYGTLHKTDEVSYIQRMVQGITTDPKLVKIIVQLLSFSQEFIREKEKNSSSVSLRDVHRCRKLITWFCEFLQSKDKFPRKGEKQGLSHLNLFNRAVRLALSHCYEVRLTTAAQRKEYWEGVGMKTYKNKGYGPRLMKFVHTEQMDILNRMVLPDGIAKNSALRENIFVLFVCILNRIPVFLVGKPGCSKSLSVQLLKSNLRGPDSDDDFLKTLPQLYIVSYQGSESSTSEGIIKVFEKAERYKKHNDRENVLPVVLLDEVGLAEISQFNPLKVLHSLLEPSTGEFPDVAVIGISNWALDAAKMNRAIHLSRPDLTVDELLDTGVAIKDGLDTHLHVPEEILNSLARAYFDYQTKQKQPMKNFHGLRDYYSIVKYICGNCPSTVAAKCNRVLQMGIERNFGGYKGSKDAFLSTCVKYLGKSFQPERSISTESLIQDNLNDKNARHLMIITSGDYSLGIIANILKDAKRGYEIIFGSQFEDDLSEEYSYRILSKIILCMEQGIVLILKDLEGIYGSLYDMLNQNYTIVGMKRNCRIALGAHSNPMCVVHGDFRCIVMVDANKVDYSDPPFLNRFEKQVLHFQELLRDQEKDCIVMLDEWVAEFSSIQDKPFKQEDAFLAYHKETLPSLLHHVATQNLQMNQEEVIQYCKMLLLKTCPPDAIMRLAISDLSKQDIDIEYIQGHYFSHVCYENLMDYLNQELEHSGDVQIARKKAVVLTRSNINTNLEEIVGSVIEVQVERLGSFKSEKQLTQQINNFFKKSTSKLLIVQCTPSLDSENMLLMKLLLENHFDKYILEMKQDDSMCIKHIIVVIHLNRQDDHGKVGWQIDYTNNWNIITVDRLEYNSFPIKTHLLGQTMTDLLLTEFVPLAEVIKYGLIEAFSSMKYTFGERSATSIWKAIDDIQSSSHLMKFLQKNVIGHIGATSTTHSRYNCENWQVRVACNTETIFQGYPFVDAWKIHLHSVAKNALSHIMWQLENSCSWGSFIDVHILDSIWLKNLWHNCFEKIKNENHFKEDTLGYESLEICHPPLYLKFPFSQSLVGELRIVESLFLAEENMEDIESLDQIDPRDRPYIVDKYSSIVEQIYVEHTGSSECDKDGLQMLQDDIYNILSYSPDIKITDEDRVSLCKLYIQTKNTDCSAFNPHTKLTLIILTWALQQKVVKCLLRLASACGQQVQQDIFKTLKNSATWKDDEILEESELDEQKNSHPEIEEIVVDKLCHQLLPTAETLKEIGNANLWFIKASQLLAFASKVSYFSPLLHFMRLCVDIYSHLPNPKEEYMEVLSSFCATCAESKSISNNTETKEIDKEVQRGEENDILEEIDDEVKRVEETKPMSKNAERKEIDNEVTREEENELLEEIENEKQRNEETNPISRNTRWEEMDNEVQREVENKLQEEIHNEVHEEEVYLDSAEGFLRFGQSMAELQPMSSMENIQRMLCLYFARCLDANSDTPRILDIANEMRKRKMPDCSLTFTGPVIHRMFCNLEINEDFNIFLNDETVEENNSLISILFQGVNIAESHPLVGLFLDITESSVKDKIPMNEESLQLFENASLTVLEAKEFSVQYFVSLAFARLYLQWIIKFFKEIHNNLMTEKKSFMQRLDGTFSILKPHACGLGSPLQLYLLKLMQTGTVEELKNEVNILEEVMPSFQTIVWPSTEMGRGIVFNAMCLHRFYTEAKDVLEKKNLGDVITSINSNMNCLQGAVAALVEKYFWVRLIRPQSDSDKVKDKVLKKINCLNEPVQTLLKGCLGIDQFLHKGLQVSTQWSYKEGVQCSFLFHVVTILSEQLSCEAASSSKSVWVQFINPEGREEQLASINGMLSLKEIKYCNIAFAKCICGHFLMTEKNAKTINCVQCGHSDIDSTTDTVTLNVHNYDIIEEVVVMCMNACVIGSVALGISEDDKDLHDDLKNLWERMQINLNLDDKMLALFLHSLLETTNQCCDLSEFSDCIRQLILNREERLLRFKFDLFAEMSKQSDLCLMLEEVGEFIPIIGNDSYFVSKRSKVPSVDLLRSNMVITCKLKDDAPFLSAVIQDSERIELLNCLPNLLKWYLLLQKFVHHRISRKQAYSMTISEFLHEDTTLTDTRRAAFENFKDEWNSLRKSKVIAKAFKGTNLNEIVNSSCITMCIVQDTEHPLYKVLDFLCNIQNDFLKKTAVIALDGCLAVTFLCKESSVIVPYTLLHTSESESIINLEWSDDFLAHCQNSTLYGYGEWIQCDLKKIEREMADALLFGKCNLILDENFPMTVYQHELFHRCSHILSDIKRDINQVQLPDHVCQRLMQSSREKHGKQSLKALLNYLEIVLSLLHKTKGNSFEKIGSFSSKWRIYDNDIQSTTIRHLLHQDVSLCHVVAMYELVEEDHAKISVESLSNQYSVSLTDDLISEVERFIQKCIPVTSFLTATRRFTVRYLSNDTNCAKSHLPMAELICHHSMWPTGVSENGCLGDGRKIADVFPSTLLAENTQALHEYLHKMAKGNEKEKEEKSSRPQIRVFAARTKKKKPYTRT